jgi:hypothetical protein
LIYIKKIDILIMIHLEKLLIENKKK